MSYHAKDDLIMLPMSALRKDTNIFHMTLMVNGNIQEHAHILLLAFQLTESKWHCGDACVLKIGNSIKAIRVDCRISVAQFITVAILMLLLIPKTPYDQLNTEWNNDAVHSNTIKKSRVAHGQLWRGRQ